MLIMFCLLISSARIKWKTITGIEIELLFSMSFPVVIASSFWSFVTCSIDMFGGVRSTRWYNGSGGVSPSPVILRPIATLSSHETSGPMIESSCDCNKAWDPIPAFLVNLKEKSLLWNLRGQVCVRHPNGFLDHISPLPPLTYSACS